MNKGNVSRAMIQNTDMLPTLLDLCGIAPNPDDLDGVSMVPLLRGEQEEIHEDLFFEFGYMRGVRTPQWKYVALRYPEHVIEKMRAGGFEVGPNQLDRFQPNAQVALSFYRAFYDPDQLFDLRSDPYEEKNLAGDPQFASVLEEMKGRMQRCLDRQPHPYELSVPEYMTTDAYRELVQKRVALGAGIVGWWDNALWDELL
jgi:arylsulfatase A-like enzyme